LHESSQEALFVVQEDAKKIPAWPGFSMFADFFG